MLFSNIRCTPQEFKRVNRTAVELKIPNCWICVGWEQAVMCFWLHAPLLWLLIPVRERMGQPPVLIGSSLLNHGCTNAHTLQSLLVCGQVKAPRASTEIINHVVPRLLWLKAELDIKAPATFLLSSFLYSSFPTGPLNVISVIPSLYMATI